MSEKNKIIVSILAIMLIMLVGLELQSYYKRKIKYSLVAESLLKYENSPSIENLKNISGALSYVVKNRDYHDNDISILASNIDDKINGYCKDDNCMSYLNKIDEYNNEIETLERIVLDVNGDEVKNLAFVCPRIVTTDDYGWIVYECALLNNGSRAALVVNLDTYKLYGGFLRATMYVRDLGPKLYRMNNYDPYRGGYETTQMIPTYKDIGVSIEKANYSKERIKTIKTELDILKPLYEEALHISWIKLFKSSRSNILDLEKSFGINNNKMWYVDYLEKHESMVVRKNNI